MIAVSRNQKILFVLLTLGLLLAVGGGMLLKRYLLPVFETYEREAAARTVARIEQAVSGRLDGLEMVNREYSQWDKLYDFAGAPDSMPDFVDEEMYPDIWSAWGVELVMILDKEGQLIWGVLTEYAGGPEVTLDDVVLPLFTENPLLNSSAGISSHTRGLLNTPVGLMLIVSKPIVRDDGSGPAAGSMLTGSILSGGQAAAIAEAADADVSVYSLANPDLAERLRKLAEKLDTQDKPFLAASFKEKRYTVSLLRDLYGDPAAVVEAIWDSERPESGNALFNRLLRDLFIAVGLFVLVAWYVIMWVTRPTPGQRGGERSE